jgi:hypothetical protein
MVMMCLLDLGLSIDSKIDYLLLSAAAAVWSNKEKGAPFSLSIALRSVFRLRLMDRSPHQVTHTQSVSVVESLTYPLQHIQVQRGPNVAKHPLFCAWRVTSAKCCVHLPREDRATRGVTFGPLCIQGVT